MRKVETCEINKVEYRITQLGGVEGRRHLPALFKIGAPLIAALCSEKEASENAEAYVVQAMQHVSPELIDTLCDSFAGATEIKAAGVWVPLKPSFDDHFAGKYRDMMRWAFRCLMLNYSDFLDGLATTSPPGGQPA